MIKLKRLFLLFLPLLIGLSACATAGFLSETGFTEPAETEGALSWAEEGVFYQVFVRSFYDGSGDGIGDFKGLKKKIPYFKDLGITALWLMPVMQAESYHGYDVIDYYTIEPDYGTKIDFQAFLQEAHRNNLKVIIDFVANHTSTRHPWFIEASRGKDSPYYHYYIWTSNPHEMPHPEENFRPLTGTARYYYAHYAYHMPDLNYHNPAVRQEIKEIARYWLNLGVDGFRLDGANVIDPDRQFTVQWWHEFNSFVKSVNPSALVVGENWYHIAEDIAEYYQALEASFNFVLAEILFKMSLGARLNIIEKIKNIHEMYAVNSVHNPATLFIDATMVNNHDMDRIATRLEGNKDKIKLAASLLLTLPGAPFLYYGDELGQFGKAPDPNRREPFPWYQNLEGTGMTTMENRFYRTARYLQAHDGISLEEQYRVRDSIYEHYRRLINIRRENTAFFHSVNYQYYPVSAHCYSYLVTSVDSGNTFLIIHNLSEEIISFPLKQEAVYELVRDKAYAENDELDIAPFGSVIIHSANGNLPFPAIEDYRPDYYTAHLIINVPENTPEDANIFMAADFNRWNPADSDYRLTREKDRYTISLQFPRNFLVQFKFTRGDWDSREQNIQGQDLVGPMQRENRVYLFDTREDEVILQVEKWADE